MTDVSSVDGQGSLFGTHTQAVETQGQPTHRQPPDASHGEERKDAQAIYGDWIVEQVFAHVSALAQQHGGTVRNTGWNGSGEVEVYFLIIDEVLDFIQKIDAICGRYQFRATFLWETYLDIHPNEDHGIRYKIRSIVPAPITIRK